MRHPETVWDSPCPACSSTGFLAGEKDYDELTGREDIEPGYEEVETVYTPIAFVCPVCGLELYGEDELSVANMDSPVIETEEREISYEPDYGNDRPRWPTSRNGRPLEPSKTVLTAGHAR